MENYVCAVTGKRYPTLRGFLNHVRTLKMTSEEYYVKYVKTADEGVCKCGNLTKYDNWSYKEWCGSDCNEFLKYRNECVSNRYKGDERNKKLQLLKERRGEVDNNLEKRRNTIILKCDKLGVSLEEYYSMHAKLGASNMSEEQKQQRTLKRFDTICNKSGKPGGRSGYKDYILFGKTIAVQGYEPIILNYLQSLLTEQELKADGKSVGFIQYNGTDGKQHMYFPDMYINNDVIEVKSQYTFNQNRENVFAKAGGVFDQDKNIIIVIPTRAEVRKNKLDGSKKLLDWAISSQASKVTQPFVAIYDEGSTTILLGVESNDSKCRGSNRVLLECDIVWSSVKAEEIQE